MSSFLKRYLTCRKCKEVWNVSRTAPYANSNYICLECSKRRRKRNGKQTKYKT
ncbi:hypothetical protein CNEO2_30004 [Clostridium neonatale]|uniref:Uncharacterized protein n=1 Tax=Clostridium neonatale TaxID=137838 RepID=A0AAD2DCJ0_9CLOT|nr:hypothetical protein CNEO2_40004 [Clostridium neonatale]CAI3210057.1 hypothetical protein CNEO2_40004 [Clostridium neonatale]CAI3215541.1 hypothetical protein CNEO2_800004 [Clostridium neonatale]CAI3224826.1 hypothetical protein CNEO2_140004 [Clostridium neonatale]CAI3242572.1 hypothetical protein CNEO2_450004 [Clostridium neonatale]